MLKLDNVHAFYGKSHVLHGVNFQVRPGEIVALLGRNGSGRSTTVKTIMGLVDGKGSIGWRGQEILGRKAFEIAQAGIGYVPEDRQIFPDHTVEDNLLIGAKKGPNGEDYWTLARIYEMLPLLEPLKDRFGGRLSGGEQQMLTIGRTLMGNPTGLLLDEPSEGLAPVIVQQIGALLRRLREMGVTVLLAEQNMHFCLGIASHATVIDKGTVVYRDTIEALRANEDIKSRYLAL